MIYLRVRGRELVQSFSSLYHRLSHNYQRIISTKILIFTYFLDTPDTQSDRENSGGCKWSQFYNFIPPLTIQSEKVYSIYISPGEDQYYIIISLNMIDQWLIVWTEVV